MTSANAIEGAESVLWVADDWFVSEDSSLDSLDMLGSLDTVNSEVAAMLSVFLELSMLPSLGTEVSGWFVAALGSVSFGKGSFELEHARKKPTRAGCGRAFVLGCSACPLGPTRNIFTRNFDASLCTCTRLPGESARRLVLSVPRRTSIVCETSTSSG